MSEHYSLVAESFQPRYDRACDKWEPRCPHGDECSGCDAVGHCAKGRAEAEVAAMSDDEIVEAMGRIRGNPKRGSRRGLSEGGAFALALLYAEYGRRTKGATK